MPRGCLAAGAADRQSLPIYPRLKLSEAYVKAQFKNGIKIRIYLQNAESRKGEAGPMPRESRRSRSRQADFSPAHEKALAGGERWLTRRRLNLVRAASSLDQPAQREDQKHGRRKRGCDRILPPQNELHDGPTTEQAERNGDPPGAWRVLLLGIPLSGLHSLSPQQILACPLTSKQPAQRTDQEHYRCVQGCGRILH